MSDWTYDDTERWLSDYPLPRDFVFPPLPPDVTPILEGPGVKNANQALVWPAYNLKKGYGFWLRTAGPYHKPLRGLYALVHEILATIPLGERLPTPEELAAKIVDRVVGDPVLPFTREDNAVAQTHNPAAGDAIAPETPL